MPDTPEKAATPTWPIALFVLGLLVAVAGLVVYNQGLTMIGLAVAAIGGMVWRHHIRKARTGQ